MGEWHYAEDHVRAAPHVCPTADLINSALSQQTKSTLWKCARDPDRANEQRGHALHTLENLPDALRPKRQRWTSALSERSPAAAINPPLISLACHALGYSDKDFATDLSRGMPIAGPIAPTPGTATRKKVPEMSYEEWKDGISKRNAQIYDRVPKSQKSDLPDACLEKTLSEIEAGWITHPVDLTDAMLATAPLTPMYAIQEQHGRPRAKSG